MATLSGAISKSREGRAGLAPQTGGPLVQGPPERDPNEAISMFLDPSLTTDQQTFLESLRKTAAARGLHGAAVESQLLDQQRQFLGQNRIGALRDVSGIVRRRIDEYRNTISPFLSQTNLAGGALGVGGRQPGESITNYLRRRQQAATGIGGAGTPYGLDALRAGLQFTGREGLLNAAGGGRYAELGTEGVGFNARNAELFGALQTYLNPQLSGAQKADPRNPLGRYGNTQTGQNLQKGLNRLRGASAVSAFLTQELGGFEQQYQDLQAFGVGLGGQSLDVNAVLGADTSGFASLFGALGLGGFGPATGGPLVGTGNRAEFLGAADLARNALRPAYQQITGG